MKAITVTLRALIRLGAGLAVLGTVLAASTLAFTTPLGKVGKKIDGQRVITVGLLHHHPNGESIAQLHPLSGNGSVYVLSDRDWPTEGLVVVSGRKRETEAGRAVIQEEDSWAVPFHWASLPIGQGFQWRLPLPTGVRWLLAALALAFVLVVVRFTLKAVSIGLLSIIGVIAGLSLARAAVDFDLITGGSLLTSAVLVAGMVVLTVGAGYTAR